MTSFPKEFNVLLDKIYGLCQKAKDMGGDWKDNILELFKDCLLGAGQKNRYIFALSYIGKR